MQTWKSLPNDGNCISIYNRSGDILDMVCYHDSMHSDYAFMTKGVALERISDHPCEPWYHCWTSASSMVSGTPGEKNSQHREEGSEKGPLKLVPRVFSPDQDGYQDLLEIDCSGMPGGERLDIVITDPEGRRVRNLCSAAVGGADDRYIWNGQDDSGKLVPPGIYVVHVFYETRTGRTQYREACALHYR
jgi:hypothetical protein